MRNLHFIRSIKFSRKLILNILISLLLIYFIFHSIYGNRGMIAYFKLNQKFEKSYAELEALRAERIEINNRVKMLRPDSLDKDMLDQQARNILGIASPKEQVFATTKKEITKD